MSSAGDRARGALYGLAIGDALGMPTQFMSHEEVGDSFGVIDGFRAALPGAEVQAFEDAGHYVLEDKHAVLVPAIRAFLDRT